MDDRICKDNAISTKNLIDIYLNTVLKKERPKKSEIYDKWDDIISNKFKHHLKIKEINNDKLILVADHPAWVQRANMSKNIILKNIKKEIPSSNIKTIHIICR